MSAAEECYHWHSKRTTGFRFQMKVAFGPFACPFKKDCEKDSQKDHKKDNCERGDYGPGEGSGDCSCANAMARPGRMLPIVVTMCRSRGAGRL